MNNAFCDNKLIVEVQLDQNDAISNKEEIRKALEMIICSTSIDISNEELQKMFSQTLQRCIIK
jgi:hypothetical protein